MEVKRYIALLWHWAWLIALAVLLAGGAGYIISVNRPKLYRSTPVRLLVDEAPGETYSELLIERSLAQTYIELIRTRPVLDSTIAALDLTISADILKTLIAISSPSNTQLIDISASYGDPEIAADIANTVATEFIILNDQRQNERYAASVQRYEDSLEALRSDRQEIKTQIAALGTPDDAEGEGLLSRLETQLNEVELRYTQTFNDLTELGINREKETSNVTIVDPAQPNYPPISPRVLNNTILSAIVGALLALGFVFLLDYLDDTVKTPQDVAQDSGLSTIGAIAYIKGDTPAGRLVTSHSPRAPVSEAFRVLRTNLSFSAIDEGLNSLLISSSSPGEGKSTTAANLAVAVAQTGQRVILVDADLRRPTQHKIFELSNNHGLTTGLLDSQTPITQHLQNSRITGLRVMTSGPIPPNPAELLNSQRMSRLVEDLEAKADLVIFDTPPALTVADAAILAQRVSGCVIVVQAGVTRRDVFVQAVERLRKTGASLFGVTLNRQHPSRGSYYDHYYYRYYAYDYDTPGTPRRQEGRLPSWLAGLTNRS